MRFFSGLPLFFDITYLFIYLTKNIYISNIYISNIENNTKSFYTIIMEDIKCDFTGKSGALTHECPRNPHHKYCVDENHYMEIVQAFRDTSRNHPIKLEGSTFTCSNPLGPKLGKDLKLKKDDTEVFCLLCLKNMKSGSVKNIEQYRCIPKSLPKDPVTKKKRKKKKSPRVSKQTKDIPKCVKSCCNHYICDNWKCPRNHSQDQYERKEAMSILRSLQNRIAKKDGSLTIQDILNTRPKVECLEKLNISTTHVGKHDGKTYHTNNVIDFFYSKVPQIKYGNLSYLSIYIDRVVNSLLKYSKSIPFERRFEEEVHQPEKTEQHVEEEEAGQLPYDHSEQDYPELPKKTESPPPVLTQELPPESQTRDIRDNSNHEPPTNTSINQFDSNAPPGFKPFDELNMSPLNNVSPSFSLFNDVEVMPILPQVISQVDSFDVELEKAQQRIKQQAEEIARQTEEIARQAEEIARQANEIAKLKQALQLLVS